MAANATITVRLDRPIGLIEPNLYGHFVENLGQCVYPGVWVGESSQIPNIEGFRKGVVEAFRAVEAPIIRWPGGCYADYYHWRDGIGPRAQRPRRVNLWWGRGVDPNEFGTHEFLRFSELVGAEPYICLNVGTGTPEEALAWLEYCNYAGDSTYARMRADNGHPEPYGVKYWAIGNENYFCGGNFDPVQYALQYRTYALYLKRLDPAVSLIACGFIGMPRLNGRTWNLRVMATLRDYIDLIDYLSIHYFFRGSEERGIAGQLGHATDFTIEQYLNLLRDVQNFEHKIQQTIEVLDFFSDGRKDVGIAIDEWGPWYADTEPGLYQQNTLRDGILTALVFNLFNRYSRKVRMSNIAQSVNVLGTLCLTKGEETVLTPTYHVYHMYRRHMGNTAIAADVESPLLWEPPPGKPSRQPERELKPMHSLDASASISPGGGTLVVTLVNLDPDEDQQVELRTSTGRDVVGGEATVLTAERVQDYNDFGGKNKVIPQSKPIEPSRGGTLSYRAPRHSVSSLVLELK